MNNLKNYESFDTMLDIETNINENTNLINENNKTNNNLKDNILNFDENFKKSLLKFNLLLILLIFIFIIFSNDNSLLLKSSKNSSYHLNNNDECNIKSILLNILNITILSLIIVLLIFILIGVSIFGPVEGSMFACCQSIGCVTSGSICASLQSFVMTNFHLIPFFSFYSSIILASIYNIFECI